MLYFYALSSGPFYRVGRFIFYKVVVKFYRFYLWLMKYLGFKRRFDSNTNNIFLSQKIVHFLVVVVTITLVFVNIGNRTKAEGFSDQPRVILASLIKSEFGDFEEDERYIMETFDREAIISPIQQSYLDNLSSFRAQPRVSYNKDVGDESILPLARGGAGIVNPELVSTKITKQPRKETIIYTVKPGDTISTIAEEFSISVSTILWENNLSAYSIIHPGDNLRILPTSGITHKIVKGETLSGIAKKYKIKEEDILSANKIKKNQVLTPGKKIFLPGAKKITYVAYKPKTYTGFTAIKSIVSAPNATPVVGNKMNWPTVGHTITQYYTWRHHGLDIANRIGTPIYAADSGVIEYAGWGRGYGNQIVINHGGGKKTRYAHLSKFYVAKGDKVTKGQTIAAMGSTGWSTGPHVHFEVIINNKRYNPLNYIR